MHSKRSHQVLVLDDQPIVADSIAQVLCSRGYDAEARYRATDILDLAAECPPDLLISDVALGPNTINGIDVALYMQRFYPECRVILISGDPNTADVYRRSLQQGHEFLLLAKPIHPEKLLQAVENALEQTEKAA